MCYRQSLAASIRLKSGYSFLRKFNVGLGECIVYLLSGVPKVSERDSESNFEWFWTEAD
jgi:hypothetical protein